MASAITTQTTYGIHALLYQVSEGKFPPSLKEGCFVQLKAENGSLVSGVFQSFTPSGKGKEEKAEVRLQGDSTLYSWEWNGGYRPDFPRARKRGLDRGLASVTVLPSKVVEPDQTASLSDLHAQESRSAREAGAAFFQKLEAVLADSLLPSASNSSSLDRSALYPQQNAPSSSAGPAVASEGGKGLTPWKVYEGIREQRIARGNKIRVLEEDNSVTEGSLTASYTTSYPNGDSIFTFCLKTAAGLPVTYQMNLVYTAQPRGRVTSNSSFG